MHRPRRFLHQRLSRIVQATAWVCVALLLSLSWLAVDPAAHACLHGHSASVEDGCEAHASHTAHACHGHGDAGRAHPAGHDDSLCVVTAFAGGVPGIFVAPAFLEFSPLITVEERVRESERLALVQSARHPPSCGPPGAV